MNEQPSAPVRVNITRTQGSTTSTLGGADTDHAPWTAEVTERPDGSWDATLTGDDQTLTVLGNFATLMGVRRAIIEHVGQA